LFFLLIVLAFSEEDYYKILELDKDATESEIKKAFRRLSVKYHPDKNPGDQEAAQKYLKVNKAYEALNDPEKKQLYDLYGEEGMILIYYKKY
jgi:DnaJ-related protein SCJ1